MSRLDRQSFLGSDSDRLLNETTVGLVGLGGGGSHVGQQFAHAGIGQYVLIDPDTIDESNTNRLIGGTIGDVMEDLPKVDIAERLIRGIIPNARVEKFQSSWHNATEALKGCDVIMGCVDSFSEREQLERFARRYLIPYIDIGMDVHELNGKQFLIAGQVFRSCPGEPCMRCCGIITDERLKQEAELYGAAGGRPQVVWPNGVLASTAVGLAVELVTPWHSVERGLAFIEYDGNRKTLRESIQVQHLKAGSCPHHPSIETGDPLFDLRGHLNEGQAKTASVHASTSWILAFSRWLVRCFRR